MLQEKLQDPDHKKTKTLPEQDPPEKESSIQGVEAPKSFRVKHAQL
jgi:hypothetical protein